MAMYKIKALKAQRWILHGSILLNMVHIILRPASSANRTPPCFQPTTSQTTSLEWQCECECTAKILTYISLFICHIRRLPGREY